MTEQEIQEVFFPNDPLTSTWVDDEDLENRTIAQFISSISNISIPKFTVETEIKWRSIYFFDVFGVDVIWITGMPDSCLFRSVDKQYLFTKTSLEV